MSRIAFLLLTLAFAAAPVAAKTLRWSSNADHSSADPHGQNQIICATTGGAMRVSPALRLFIHHLAVSRHGARMAVH